MKNFILIILLVVVTFGAIHILDYKEPYAFESINNIEVLENKTTLELITEKEITNFRWFFDYEIKNKEMYITTYQVLNPLSKTMGPSFKFTIQKGYKDFEKIYLNDEEENKLIWSKS